VNEVGEKDTHQRKGESPEDLTKVQFPDNLNNNNGEIDILKGLGDTSLKKYAAGKSGKEKGKKA